MANTTFLGLFSIGGTPAIAGGGPRGQCIRWAQLPGLHLAGFRLTGLRLTGFRLTGSPARRLTWLRVTCARKSMQSHRPWGHVPRPLSHHSCGLDAMLPTSGVACTCRASVPRPAPVRVGQTAVPRPRCVRGSTSPSLPAAVQARRRSVWRSPTVQRVSFRPRGAPSCCVVRDVGDTVSRSSSGHSPFGCGVRGSTHAGSAELVRAR